MSAPVDQIELAGSVRARSQCPNQSYELPLRSAEVPRFSRQQRSGTFSIRAPLRRWLRAQLTDPVRWVVHRAQLVTRFLDWLVKQKVSLSILSRNCANTSAAPRLHCRALVAPTIVALKLSVRHRAMEVIWTRHARSHPAHAQLGYHYGMRASFFDSTLFLQARPVAAAEPLSKLILEYAAQSVASLETPASSARQHRSVGSDAYRTASPSIVPDRLLLHDVARSDAVLLYTATSRSLLLKTARTYPGRRRHCDPTLYTMLSCYCAGLRLGEIVVWNSATSICKDIDVRDTSSSSLAGCHCRPAPDRLANYLFARRKREHPRKHRRPCSCMKRRIQPDHSRGIAQNVIRRAGLNTHRGRGGPRIHDIRHTFVVHRMTAWYREGINPQNRLQYLATYLGHLNIHSTLIYLTITQNFSSTPTRGFVAPRPAC